jgi:hypothetical protein
MDGLGAGVWMPVPHLPVPVGITLDRVPRVRGMRLIEVAPRYRGMPLAGVRIELPIPEIDGEPLVEVASVGVLDSGLVRLFFGWGVAPSGSINCPASR